MIDDKEGKPMTARHPDNGGKEPRTRTGRETEMPVPWAVRPFEEMERFYQTLFPRGWLRHTDWEWPFLERMRPAFARKIPAVDVIDRENEVVVRAEVPGVSKKDLHVSLSDNAMTIRGRTEHEEEKKKEDYYYREMSYGEFTRTLTLPADVDTAKAKATMKDGLLEVTLPKVEGARRKAMDIAIE
jgi:HSP20 family protein